MSNYTKRSPWQAFFPWAMAIALGVMGLQLFAIQALTRHIDVLQSQQNAKISRLEQAIATLAEAHHERIFDLELLVYEQEE